MTRLLEGGSVLPAFNSIASRVVTKELQASFAALSGDRNPIHMDPIAARRTPAGREVVHGIHSLLWALDSLAASGRLLSTPTMIKAKFPGWLRLGDMATLCVPRESGSNPASLQVESEGVAVLSVQLFYEPASRIQREFLALAPPAPDVSPSSDSFLGQFEKQEGSASIPGAVSSMFPHLAAAESETVVAEIACCSYIVGMECPGHYSTLSRLELSITPAPAFSTPGHGVSFRLTSADERFRKGRIAVSGRAIKGTLDVFVRVPPVDQFSMRSIIGRVTPNEFTGMDALVIGGSRGLGALAARIIAAGGGHATITYLVGKAEADCNVEEIQEYGGRARSMAFDVREPPEPQLRGLETTPTHLFYFATCPILRSRKSIFSFHEFAALLQFYVQEFFNLCNCLLRFRSMKAATDRLIVFYPSTVFIEETPAGLLEYAMAKAAGEQLCAGMNKSLSGIFVVSRRLPKIKTDQTASMIPEQYADGMLTLLPIVRELWRLSRSQGQLLENLGGTADDV